MFLQLLFRRLQPALMPLAAALLLPLMAPAQQPKSVWAVDFVRTKPGQAAKYLASVRDNWAAARYYAQRAGYITSYRAYTTQADSSADFDVVLMTEYADSAVYRQAEANFDKIFQQYFPVRTSTRDLRDIRFSKNLRELPLERKRLPARK